MSKHFDITGIEFSDVERSFYDLGIFASGYEERGINVASLLDPSMISGVSVIGFSNRRDGGKRKENDRFFKERWDAHFKACTNLVSRALLNHISMATCLFLDILPSIFVPEDAI
jgi:hypothetical protein